MDDFDPKRFLSRSSTFVTEVSYIPPLERPSSSLDAVLELDSLDKLSCLTIKKIVKRFAKIERKLGRKAFKGTVFFSHTQKYRYSDVQWLAIELVTSGYYITDEWDELDELDDLEFADVVLIFFNECYKKSKRCRIEAQRAFRLQKKVIVVAMDTVWPIKGWMGVSLGEDDYLIDFSSSDDFHQFFRDLSIMIEETAHPSDKDTSNARAESSSTRKKARSLFDFKTVNIPPLSRYFPRPKEEPQILGLIKETCHHPEAGALLLYGDHGIGKTSLISHIFNYKGNHTSLLHECQVHIAIWINCYEWTDVELHTFGAKDLASQRAIVWKILEAARKVDSPIPNFYTLAELYSHFQADSARPILIFDDLTNMKLLQFVRNQCGLIPCIAITHDKSLFQCVPPFVNEVEELPGIADDEIGAMLLKPPSKLSEYFSEVRLHKLACRCLGSPLISNLVSIRFADQADNDNLFNSLVHPHDPTSSLTDYSSTDRRLTMIGHLYDGILQQMDESQRLSFNAFLFFDPNEVIFAEDMALLWGFGGDTFKTGGLLRAKALCHMYESKGLIIASEDDNKKQAENCYYLHHLIYQVALQRMRRVLKVTELSVIRLRLISGAAKVRNNADAKVRPDSISILCEAVAQHRFDFLTKAFNKITPNEMSVFCGQRSSKTGRKTFMHHLYYCPPIHPVTSSETDAIFARNECYGTIAMFLHKAVSDKHVNFIELFKQSDSDGNSLLSDIFRDENELAYQNDRNRLINLLSRYWEPPSSFSEIDDDDHGEAAVLKAAQMGRVDTMNQLMRKKWDLISYQRKEDGMFPVALASKYGHLDVIQTMHKSHPNETTATFRLRDNRGMIPLMMAASNGHLDTVEYLSEKDNRSILLQDSAGHTAGHWAAMMGHWEIMATLLQHDSSILNMSNARGQNPFMEASRFGQMDIVQYLYKHDPDSIGTEDKNGRNALMLAVEGRHVEIAKFILGKSPGSIKHRDKIGRTPLMLAARSGYAEMVDFLFKNCRSIVEAEDNSKWTTLMYAAEGGSVECCQFLYLNYVEPVANANEEGDLPMMIAARKGNLDVVKYLLPKYTEALIEKNNDGWTALGLAALGGHVDVFNYLYHKREEAIKLSNAEGCIPLMAAAMSRQLACVEAVYEKWPEAIQEKNDNGWTAFLFAAQRGCFDIVGFLYGKFPDVVKLRNNKGTSCIMLAAANGHLPMTKFLVDAYSEAVKMQNMDGMTALMFAAAGGRKEVVEFLVDRYPETIQIVDMDGRTTTSHAAGAGHLEIVRLLGELHLPSLSKASNDGWTPVMFAADQGHKNVVQYLCDNVTEATRTLNNENQSPLFVAAAKGQLEIVKLLYERDPHQLLTEDLSQKTAYLIAKDKGFAQAAAFLRHAMMQ